jgi:peptide/nickel transport system ATP-binding protein/oligopeptide transport system ATP-binding protein
MSLLEASGLVKSYARRRNLFGRPRDQVQAVQGVSFSLAPGETLALVGESGAGKSTVGRLVLRLVEPDGGRLVFDGTDMLGLDRDALRRLRRGMQMIFQDPYSSLDPRITVGESIGEPLLVHFGTARRERRERAVALLRRVGMSAGDADRLPGELSGGQLQRVAIARALTLNPRLIVCDEPVAALDVSIRAQVINLMKDLQEEFGVAYLFITHDLGLVEAIADRVAVMQQGRLVEEGTTAALFAAPREPYTRTLLAAVPRIKR